MAWPTLTRLGSHSPGVYEEDEYQVATVCQAETKTQSDGNVDPEFSLPGTARHSPQVSTTVCPAI